MRLFTKLIACGAGIAAIMLAGCSGGSGDLRVPATGDAAQQDAVKMRSFADSASRELIPQEFPLLAVHSLQKPITGFVNSAALAKTPTTIAVANAANQVETVNIYDPAGNMLAQLTGFNTPAGLASDIKGDLYVADAGNQRVQVYAAGFKSAPTTLSEPGRGPDDVDTFNNGKIVAVSNFYSNHGQGYGDVVFFTNGKLTNTVSNQRFYYIYNCAFDAVGNLYVVGGNDGGIVVGEIIGGARGHEITTLTTSNMIKYPGGIQVTPDGKIAIGDHNNQAIYTYNAPVGTSLGKPVFTTPIPGRNDLQEFAFTRDMSSVYTADGRSGLTQKHAYPAGGNALSEFYVGYPAGVAIIPTEYPQNQK